VKAISYLRFSTPEQALGDSQARQLKAARDYCARNGLELDEELSISDEGISGYSGKNIERGSLGHFLAEVQAGKIPAGTALIIENLDRLSRQGIDKTTDLLKDLTAHGIDVHVIALNRVLRAGFNNSLIDYVIIGVQADLAHQESVKKSERIGSAWNAKKAAAADGKLYTSKLPHWLTVQDGKPVEIPEKVATVREMFRLSALGLGSTQIQERLNGDVLSRSWVIRTLGNRAVLGEFQPTGGEVNVSYFPQIVTQSEFEAARRQIDSHRKNQNRHRKNQADRPAANLFGGLVFDTTDEPPRLMTFQEVTRKKTGVQHRYLTSSFAVNLPQHSVNYDSLEYWVLDGLGKADWQAIVRQTEPEELVAAMVELDACLRELDVVKNRIERNTAAINDETEVASIKVLSRIVAKDEGLIITLDDKRNALQANVDALKARFSALYNVDVLLGLIAEMEKSDRLRLRAEIAKILKRINVRFTEYLIYIDVEFINGARSGKIQIPSNKCWWFKRDGAEVPETSQDSDASEAQAI